MANTSRRAGVAQWKRQVTVFGVLMVALVVAVAGGSALYIWQLLRDIAATERAVEVQSTAVTGARQATLEVDRLLMQTIALRDPDKVRAAAVASIAAASRLEDSITALHRALPNSADAAEMGRLVESLKSPRMSVIALARKGEHDHALERLSAIVDPLKRIDALSTDLQTHQHEDYFRAAERREQQFGTLMRGLISACVASVVFGLLSYWRLMKKLARTDEMERLLGEVHTSAGQLDSDGQRLAQLNADISRANAELDSLMARLRASFGAMDEDTVRAMGELNTLTESCSHSMATSRQQAGDASVVAQQIKATVSQMRELQKATEALGQSRGQIATFTERIARISSTTRLLSMNATVEAARAGEAGRGFNAVAMSIRQLSEDTQTAAIEIQRASEDIDRQLGVTEQSVRRTRELMEDCSQRIAVLEACATQNRQLAEAMAGDVEGFRTTFERQTGRVRAMDDDVSSLDGTVQAGHSHARLLDGTAQALSETSSRMFKRVASVMN
ncbi:MAG TPA: methyl-accepting chemotaxis protein [Burkholderiaceae bacterium]|nr:methyl-accepting chemotaxis protein [Burkholderiaceae bacterium]